MKSERMQEIRRLANPATNARWLSLMLNEALDALESITSAVTEDWTSSVVLPGSKPTEEYGPGVVERLLAGEDPDVITSANWADKPVTVDSNLTAEYDAATADVDRRFPVTHSSLYHDGERFGAERMPVGSGTVAEKVGPEETRPGKRPGKERK